jgi:5-methyltetrahydrofolate--homocysteine methyltransferase
MPVGAEPQEKMKIQPLLFKEDWPRARERFLAFWEREIVDRACIAVTAPQKEQISVPEGQSAEEQIVDPEIHLARFEAFFQNTYWGGEALPAIDSILGQAALGGKPIFQALADNILGTIWIEPTIEDWDRTPYNFDPDNPWCRKYIEFKRKEFEAARGKYLVALEGLLWPADMLSLLRGPQRLCMDLIDNPEQVKNALASLKKAYKWVNDTAFEAIHAKTEGAVSLGIWAPGRYVYLGCDFSCMISPGHFKKFVLPDIEEFATWLEYNFYHLDGPEALKHLPALLEVSALKGIQFERGAANLHLPASHWIPVYQQIQAAGKLLCISAQYSDVEVLLRHLDPRGVFIVTEAPDPEAAEQLLENARTWSRRGTVYPNRTY